MKSYLLSFTLCLLLFIKVRGQEKWSCYTDKQELLVDNQQILGVFDYVDNSVWFVTNKGINIFKDDEWKTINKKTDLLKNKIGAYLVDSKDQIWIGTGSPDIFFDGYALGQLYQGGVVIYNGTEWKPMNTKEMGIKAPVITRMFEASNGDIWMGVSSIRPGGERSAFFPKGALLRRSSETGEWTDYRQKDMPCNECHFVKGFYEDVNGRVHFMADSGLYYFKDGSFRTVRKDNENFAFSGGSWITARFVDSKNRLWLGAPARNAMYNGKEWRSFNRKNGLPSMENHPNGFIETPDGKIIMSTTNGLYTFDGENEWKQEKIKVIFGNSYLDDQNRLWIPTLKGLIIRDGENESINKDLPRVVKIFKDRNGGVWALLRGKGIARYKDDKWEHFNKNNKLPSNSIMLTYVSDNGDVWLGTNKGICRCEYD